LRRGPEFTNKCAFRNIDQNNRHSKNPNHCILRTVKADFKKNGVARDVDIGSRDALDRFRKAAKAFTARATQSRETARQVLISEGIYTKSGKLAKSYR